MTKQEYKNQQEIIINEFGKPEYDMHEPVNESAKRLTELKQAYLKARNEAEKHKKLADTVKVITENVQYKHQAVPDDVIRPEYLAAFNEKQKRIINQWGKNINQSAKQISDELNISTLEVKAVFTLAAFKILKLNLTRAVLDTVLPLPAVLTLKECLQSDNPSVKLNALKLVLINVGLLKDTTESNVDKPSQIAFDKETEEQLRKLGSQILGIKKNEI